MPAPYCGNDFVGIGSPYEWLGLLISLVEEELDCGLKVGDRPKDAALLSALCDGREEALDGVEARGGCWREMECPPQMGAEPMADFRMLMSCVIVENGVDRLSRRNLLRDGAQKADELLMAMALHIATDHRGVEHRLSPERLDA